MDSENPIPVNKEQSRINQAIAKKADEKIYQGFDCKYKGGGIRDTKTNNCVECYRIWNARQVEKEKDARKNRNGNISGPQWVGNFLV